MSVSIKGKMTAHKSQNKGEAARLKQGEIQLQPGETKGDERVKKNWKRVKTTHRPRDSNFPALGQAGGLVGGRSSL